MQLLHYFPIFIIFGITNIFYALHLPHQHMEPIEKHRESIAPASYLRATHEHHQPNGAIYQERENQKLRRLPRRPGSKTYQRKLPLVVAYDIFLSFVIILVFIIPTTIAVIVKLMMDGMPLLYNSKRIGKRNVSFTVFKFRSMIDDQKFIKEYLKDHVTAGFEKIPSDCILYTRTGRFFEKFQIVEILQIFNVLRREMSIIGYRPLPIGHVNYLEQELGQDKMGMRHSVLPGMTGLSQIYGKLNLSNAERVDLENSYNIFVLTQPQLHTIYLNTLIIAETGIRIFLKRDAFMSHICKIINNATAADPSFENAFSLTASS